MKKRIIVYLLVVVLLLLSACGPRVQNDQGIAPETESSADTDQGSKFISIEGGTSMEEAAPLQFNTGYQG